MAEEEERDTPSQPEEELRRNESLDEAERRTALKRSPVSTLPPPPPEESDPLETVAISLVFLFIILAVVVYRSPQWPAIAALFRRGA